ncbi:MAG TPA: right-handed parallel beta-helix repeat-containing protein, partial [Bacillota bacterium]|nr:right-handed parallel beta-helix repeat-containing protein [Bacillota bacterium]
EGLVVEDCDFDDCRWSAVFMLGKKGSVNNCRIDNVGESSIYSESSAEYPTEYNSATNNKISNAYMIDVTACGIEWSTPNSVIADNIITGCGGDGIAITNLSYVTVENNIISNCNKEGFTFGGGIGLALKDGITLPKQGKGISINNNICYDDQAVKTQKYGIYVTNYGGSGVYSETIIVDNILFDNSIADFLVDGTVLANNTNKYDDNWHPLSLLNSWVDFGGEYNTSGYCKDQSGRVYLKGFIKGGTTNAGTVLFNLPIGYRPKNRYSIATLSNGGGTATPCVIDISVNGNVQIGAYAVGNTWLALDGICFSLQ